MITHQKINQLIIEFNSTGNISISALKAGMHRKTAARYLHLNDPYNPPPVIHNWRTREDKFAGIWPEVEEMLKNNPKQQAKILFGHFQKKYPGQFSNGQLRTFQRRINLYCSAVSLT